MLSAFGVVLSCRGLGDGGGVCPFGGEESDGRGGGDGESLGVAAEVWAGIEGVGCPGEEPDVY